MWFALQFVPFLIFLGLIALCLRISGRLMAATTLSWPLCLKYGAIVGVSIIALGGLARSLGPAGVWIAPVLALGVQALIGAFYLGSRAKKDSGFDLGPVTGAKVAVAAAFVSLLIAVALAAVSWVLRATLL